MPKRFRDGKDVSMSDTGDSGRNEVLSRGERVRHARLGIGQVVADEGATAIVRFNGGLEECLKRDLERLVDPLQAATSGQLQPALDAVLRAQALLIRSINDAWGVFARSRIQLLPHQLWVCQRVLEQWPTHWLVADDVGLGKTVEAGLILSGLRARLGAPVSDRVSRVARRPVGLPLARDVRHPRGGLRL